MSPRPAFAAAWLVAPLLALSFGSVAFAHGGGWRQPPPPVITGNPGHSNHPGGGNPSGPATNPGDPKGPPTDPGKGGGDTTPPNDGPPDKPSTPSAAPAPASTPGPTAPPTQLPTGPATAGPKAPPTGARTGPKGGLGRRSTGDGDRWEHWWAGQRELYLTRRHGVSPNPRTLAGSTGGAPVLPDLRTSLLPILASALRDPSSDVADSAAIALGRCVRAEEAGPIVPVLASSLRHPDRAVVDAAALGLGILGGTESIRPLADLALDGDAGRALCRTGGPVDPLLRSQAALALGLTRTTESLAPLTRLALAGDTPREIAASAVLALGLAHDAAPAVAVSLVKLLDDRSLDREVRAQVPIALARLPGTAARAALPKLVQLLGDKMTSDVLARSAAIALGRIATVEDGEVVDLLLIVTKQDEDFATRQFALLALGRLYERARESTDRSALTAEVTAKRALAVQAFLVEQMRHPTHKSLEPYAALALGMFARGDETFDGATPSPTLVATRKALADAFTDEADPSVAGAVAIATGLAGASEVAPLLLRELGQTANPTLRGHLAVALGLLKEPAAKAPLTKLLADPALPPAARIDVARGLAMVGDPDLEERLIALLKQSGDTPSAIAYSKALGIVGSDRAAASLVALVQDRTAPALQRAFAVVALGLIGEKTALPWNVPYLVDANYTVPLRALDEIADIL
jgi:HEAT repeat protein